MTKPWIAHYESHVPPTIDIPDTPLSDCLRRNALRYPKRAALIFFDNKITYREVNDAVDRFAAGLQKLGIGKGDRVAVYMPNCPQYVIAYYGALRVGAIVVPCNPLYVARELEHQFRDAGVKIVVTLSSFYHTVREVRAHVDSRDAHERRQRHEDEAGARDEGTAREGDSPRRHRVPRREAVGEERTSHHPHVEEREQRPWPRPDALQDRHREA